MEFNNFISLQQMRYTVPGDLEAAIFHFRNNSLLFEITSHQPR
jgi:hypothetical protein